ncbi:MAG: hypothetical protein AAF541_20295 [Pseudomonadota bacterium]
MDEMYRTGGAMDAMPSFKGKDPLIGQRLGDYQVEELLAEGGMSRVYVGSRIEGAFERKVAIKVSPIGGLEQLAGRSVPA